MSEEVNHVPMSTPDFHSETAQKLAELLPEVVADGKIDVAALQAVLGEDATTGGGRTLRTFLAR